MIILRGCGLVRPRGIENRLSLGAAPQRHFRKCSCKDVLSAFSRIHYVVGLKLEALLGFPVEVSLSVAGLQPVSDSRVLI